MLLPVVKGLWMPLIVLTLLVAVVAGLWLPRRAAFAVTGALCAATLVTFVWSVADRTGDDPWWLVLVALTTAGLALAVVALFAQQRPHRQVRT